MFLNRWQSHVLGVACALLCSSPAWAASLQVQLQDSHGQPLANAVVSLNGPQGAPVGPIPAIMDQVQKQFLPAVLAVRSGTRVSFPNRDDIRHQVYSFSPAKRFELRLYKDTPSEPVLFDKPGLVVLGCNIHDWMVGYIYVTDDPWFAVSDEAGKLHVHRVLSATDPLTDAQWERLLDVASRTPVTLVMREGAAITSQRRI